MESDPLNILLIEHEDSDAHLFRMAVQRTGLNLSVHRVMSGETARDYLHGTGIYSNRQEYPLPDGLVIQLLADGLADLEFLKWCKKAETCKCLPLVVLTGALPCEPLVQAALEQGADRVYTKPMGNDKLTSIIREIYAFGMESKRDSTRTGSPPHSR